MLFKIHNGLLSHRYISGRCESIFWLRGIPFCFQARSEKTWNISCTCSYALFPLVIWTWTTSVERVNLQTRLSGKSKILALSKTGTGSVDSLLKYFMFNERRECVYPDREVQWLLQIPPTLFSSLYLLRLREIEALLTVIQISGLYSIDGNDGRGINGLSWLRGRSVDGTTKLRAAVRTISNQSASRFVHLNWVLLLSAMNAKWFEHFKIEHTFTYDKHMYLYVNWIFNKTSTDLAL